MSNCSYILQKIKSVKATSRITHALEIISSTRFHVYKDLQKKSLPYLQGVYQIFYEVFNNPDHDIKETNKKLISFLAGKQTLWFVIGTDIGMCGDFNDKLKNYLASTVDLDHDGVIIFGNRLNTIISNFLGDSIELFSKSELNSKDLVEDLRDFSFKAFDLFMRKHYQKLVLIYLKDPKKGIIEKLNILPFTSNYFPKKKKVFVRSLNIGVRYPDAVIDFFPRYLECIILGSFITSKLQEHEIRKELMHYAHKNAMDLIDEYTLMFNKLRQENITKEISEIVVASQLKKR